ncbi:MAG: cupredoxin domain-containing protein [Thiolinea sp.]
MTTTRQAMEIPDFHMTEKETIMKSLPTLLLTSLIIGVCHSAAFAAEHKIAIKGMAFSPAELSVEVGDTLTFTNEDLAPHTGTATDKSFDTGILNQGESKTVEITKEGTIDYFCGVHPSMKGKVTVKAAAPASTETTEDKEEESGGSSSSY